MELTELLCMPDLVGEKSHCYRAACTSLLHLWVGDELHLIKQFIPFQFTLNIIIESAYLISVLFQESEGIVIAKIFKLD